MYENKTLDTAILLFTRNPREEALAKPLSGGKSLKEDTLLAGYLIAHSKQTIAATGLPCFPFYSEQQVGISFQERLSHACRAIFDKGYEKLIVIGNDSPGLEADRLLEAQALLEKSPLVLGPAEDGGLYLIGLHRTTFDATAFEALPWSTNGLFEAAQNTFLVEDSAVLSSLGDIDSFGDLWRFIHEVQQNAASPLAWLKEAVLKILKPRTILHRPYDFSFPIRKIVAVLQSRPPPFPFSVAISVSTMYFGNSTC